MRDLLMHLREILLANRIGNRELPRIIGDDVVVKELLALLGEIEKRVENSLRPALGRGDAFDPDRG